MKNLIKIVSIFGLISISPLGYSVDITDTYTTGDTLTAETLENIKSAVNSKQNRVTEVFDSSISYRIPVLDTLDPGTTNIVVWLVNTSEVDCNVFVDESFSAWQIGENFRGLTFMTVASSRYCYKRLHHLS